MTQSRHGASRSPAEPETIALRGGASLELAVGAGAGAASDTLRLRGSGGECLLTVELTDAGPVVRLSGVNIEIAAAGQLRIACDTLAVDVASGAAVRVGGDLREHVGGAVTRDAGGDSTTSARSVAVIAQPGGVVVRGNDDVRITGERILLNSDDPPMPLTWDEFVERQGVREGSAIERGPREPALGAAGRPKGD